MPSPSRPPKAKPPPAVVARKSRRFKETVVALMESSQRDPVVVTSIPTVIYNRLPYDYANYLPNDQSLAFRVRIDHASNVCHYDLSVHKLAPPLGVTTMVQAKEKAYSDQEIPSKI